LVAVPVIRVAVVFTPLPLTATFTVVANPPPETGILPVYVCTAVGLNFTYTTWLYVPPACVRLNEVVYVPPEVVEKVYPFSGPTFTFAVVRNVPLMVNEFGPALLLIQAGPKAVSAVADKEIGTAGVVKGGWAP